MTETSKPTAGATAMAFAAARQMGRDLDPLQEATRRYAAAEDVLYAIEDAVAYCYEDEIEQAAAIKHVRSLLDEYFYGSAIVDGAPVA